MDIGSILLTLSLFVFVAFFVARPLFERTPATPATSETDHTRSFLLAERERLLNALQELDFDFTLGKVPEEDYPAQRATLLRRGAEVLRKLDELETNLSAPQAEEDLVEAALAARREALLAEPSVAKADDEIEALLANRRRARQEKSAGFCPHCGKPVMKSDRFCSKCGSAL